MSAMFSVAAPEGLRPDPDENSAPIATLDPTDLVSVDKTLDPWTKVTLTKAGLPLSGWLISADLIPVQQATVRLFDEPLGNLLQTLTGRIDVLAKVATWAKVKVTPPDGSAPSVGWTRGRRRRARRDRAQQACWTARERSGERRQPRQGTISCSGRTTAIATRSCKPSRSPASTPLRSRRSLTPKPPKSAAERTLASGTRSRATPARAPAGLTQFLEATWCDMACRPGKVLNKAARQNNMVTSNNQVVGNMRKGLLALRFDPTMSIVTAAEYGADNLNALIKDKLVESDIGDDDRAWHIYLAHHEGLAGAEHFLRNDETIPFSKLVEQVGTARANQLVLAAGGDVTIAYRKWLTDFMEQKIQPSRFRMSKAPTGKVIAPTARALGQISGAGDRLRYAGRRKAGSCS